MSVQDLKSRLPDYAKDIKLNLSAVLSEEGAEGLSQRQIYGIALASAYATRNKTVIESLTLETEDKITTEEMTAAKAAATIMGMNNVYYRFTHMVSDTDYRKLPAKLRMNVIGRPGIEKVDFELYSLAVSAINGCAMCIEAHVHEVLKAGISKTGIQSAIRIAAVISAAAQVLTIEDYS
tara:strand:- start:11605 stop:12141 length:537 start_codon:yes stop_codon:yes gene_type:complete